MFCPGMIPSPARGNRRTWYRHCRASGRRTGYITIQCYFWGFVDSPDSIVCTAFRVPIRPVVRLPTAVFVPCCGRASSRRNLLTGIGYVVSRDDALPGKGQPTDMVPATQDVRATDRVYNDTMLILVDSSIRRIRSYIPHSAFFPLPGRESSRNERNSYSDT